MSQIELLVLLLGLIAIVGFIFRKSVIPTSLFLVLTGILLSLPIDFPLISRHPDLVLNVFLPLLLYQISSFSSWREYRKQIKPILLLSVGHVLFITVLVACFVRYCFPQISWPLAFIIGAVVSPPDDVAIISIAEKVKMPSKIVTILEGEGIFNDATALILFRFSIAALITHQFIITQAVFTFVFMMVAETVYGIFMGHLLGRIRLYLRDPYLHMLVSLITPFIAYLPAERLGGCGVISTVVIGFIIGNYYSVQFTPEFRLLSRAVWPTISFMIQSFLFLLVGVNIDSIYQAISTVPILTLVQFLLVVLTTVVLGRFVWVYPTLYLPKFFIKNKNKNKKKKHSFSWQSTFVISWSGLRGAISLAAALAVPSSVYIDNINARDLVTFLVFGVILFTLIIQGISLPWVVKFLGIQKHRKHEIYLENKAELRARKEMCLAAMKWLNEYIKSEENQELIEEINVQLENYKLLKRHLNRKINENKHYQEIDEQAFIVEETNLMNKLIEVEKNLLISLWENEKISLATRNKLMEQLDLRVKSIIE
ncbi:MAG: Na+/H+ antiporter [Proteobacteria bacterium]|nr:Na+/H+ antiporter [Pseudomonadota bacterium]